MRVAVQIVFMLYMRNTYKFQARKPQETLQET